MNDRSHNEAHMERSSSDFVLSLERGLAVMRAFGTHGQQLTLSDISKAVGIPRASARRFLLTLVAIGYARTDGKHFELMPAVLELGYSYLHSQGFIELANLHLATSTQVLGETCSMAVLEGVEAVCVATAPSGRRSAFSRIQVGSRLPAHATALGHVLLAGLDDDELEQFLHEPSLHRFTERTLTKPAELRARVEQVRRDGFAVVSGALEFGLQAISVPVTTPDGRTVAAVNASRRASDESGEALQTIYLPALIRLAAQCSRTNELLAS
jgi:IclR family pca regulon transcriptional regulator